MRAQLNESVSSSQELNEKFTLEIKAKEELQKHWRRRSRQTTLIEEENNQLTEMRGIIEQQVIKIEQLKEELFEKSNEFDSLIAEMDIGRGAITQQPTTQSENPGTSSSSQRSVMPEEDLSEPVSRAELDLALYMLHQRDVRCEELMVELTHLLEERDTLQLRLSNAIREKEDLRRKLSGGTQAGALPSLSNPDPSTPISKSSAIFLAASGTELATEPSETPTSGQVLANKLSELKKVNYKRDKTLVDEQQLRRLQQMSIMEQHINEASKLPPEAQAKLVDASYTLSRDVQSPSKVLLNWLWGNSTPKMNDS
ncbi:hypothetical protein JTB14_021010 [Gonioctena quinquepunctata]|nr:hypothetical protein JTB14_021010 [Gonioctena quinquepunctata]